MNETCMGKETYSFARRSSRKIVVYFDLFVIPNQGQL